MKLIIDIGNTRIKAALFEKNELKQNFVFETKEDLLKSDLFETYSIENCIIATVVNEIEGFINELKLKTNILLFTDKTNLPIKNLYKSTSTLGSDRLAAAVGGNFMFGNKNVLIIDAGTCIKYNFVSDKNEFMGGGISPGLQMRFKALNDYTSRLPLISLEADYDLLIGNNTNNSILSGIVLGTLTEVEGIIEQYKLLYNNLTVVLTGGDINFFEKRLKKSIFADPNLILNGLNIILDYTINAKT